MEVNTLDKSMKYDGMRICADEFYFLHRHFDEAGNMLPQDERISNAFLFINHAERRVYAVGTLYGSGNSNGVTTYSFARGIRNMNAVKRVLEKPTEEPLKKLEGYAVVVLGEQAAESISSGSSQAR